MKLEFEEKVKLILAFICIIWVIGLFIITIITGHYLSGVIILVVLVILTKEYIVEITKKVRCWINSWKC